MGAAMHTIIWTDDFVLGIEPIDSHHQHFINLINTSVTYMTSNAPVTDVEDVLKELVAYADYHFTFEEAWMRECGFPHLGEHRKTHAAFSENVDGLQKQLCKGSSSARQELAEYLNFWLIDHIIICDSIYADFTGTRKTPGIMT